MEITYELQDTIEFVGKKSGDGATSSTQKAKELLKNLLKPQ